MALETIKKFGIRQDDVICFVQSVLDEEDVTNSNIDITGTSDSSEGSTGLIIYIDVKCIKSQKPIIYHLVVKHIVANEGQKAFKLERLYHIEAIVYSQILPIIQKTRTSKILPPLHNLLKFYKFTSKENLEMIMFENATSEGFVMHEISKSMDLDHIRIVLDAYAKWHSSCIVMRLENPEAHKILLELNRIKLSLTEFPGPDLFGYFHKTLVEALTNAGENELVEKVKEYDFIDLIKRGMTIDDYSVITHEDCWNSNYLFKYQDGKPLEVKIIDWQVASSNYLERDLSTFILSAILPEDFDKINGLLDYYYEKFAGYLRELGHDPEKVYPREVFDGHWQFCAKYVVIRALFHFSKIVAEEAELTNMGDVINKEECKMDEIYACTTTNEAAVDRTVKLLKWLDNNNLL